LRYVQSDVRAALAHLLAVVDRYRDELQAFHVVVTAKRTRRLGAARAS
jgi:hypothetical protein